MIFIEGNVPSLKNSKVMTKKGIFSSPTVSRWLRNLGIQSFSSSKKIVKGYIDKTRPNKIEELRSEFNKMKVGIDDPILIGFHQVRNSKRLFDFSNSVEVIQDLFTAHDFIKDDNVKYIYPIPMTIEGELASPENRDKLYSVDKNNPGVYIKLF